MVKVWYLFLLLLNITFISNSWAEKAWEGALKKNFLQEIKKSGLEKSLALHVSYEDGDLHRDLFELSTDKAMIPASVTKLITAGALLSGLGQGKNLKPI